jgi:hypothetical protein
MCEMAALRGLNPDSLQSSPKPVDRNTEGDAGRLCAGRPTQVVNKSDDQLFMIFLRKSGLASGYIREAEAAPVDRMRTMRQVWRGRR